MILKIILFCSLSLICTTITSASECGPSPADIIYGVIEVEIGEPIYYEIIAIDPNGASEPYENSLDLTFVVPEGVFVDKIVEYEEDGNTKAEWTVSGILYEPGQYKIELRVDDPLLAFDVKWLIINVLDETNNPQLTAPSYWYGDLNVDGNINVVDLALMANNWLLVTDKTNFRQGDLNLDGKVNLIDLNELVSNWREDISERTNLTQNLRFDIIRYSE